MSYRPVGQKRLRSQAACSSCSRIRSVRRYKNRNGASVRLCAPCWRIERELVRKSREAV